MFLPYFCTPFKKGTGELVAQLVEQYTFNVWALGSSPSQFTKAVSAMKRLFFYNFEGGSECVFLGFFYMAEKLLNRQYKFYDQLTTVTRT